MSSETEELTKTPTEIWRKIVPGRESSTYKGPEAGRTLAANANRPQAGNGGGRWSAGGCGRSPEGNDGAWAGLVVGGEEARWCGFRNFLYHKGIPPG